MAGMRRVAVSVVAAAAGVVLACTAFDFPAPSGASTDAAPDAPGDVDAGLPVSQLLSLSDAARFCAQLFRCPRLDEATELSIALPVATPLGFSACMDWVAGPIDPARVGLTTQQGLLKAVALAGSCDAAYGALPVRPVDAGVCVTACPDSTDLQTCARDAGAFLLPCAPPYFGQTGTCYADDAGVGLCVTGGPCTLGRSCTDPGTLADCFSAKLSLFSTYDCTLSGRQCHTTDCVAPGHSAAPCPLQDVRDGCDGPSVLHCAGGLSAQTEIDCAAVGRGCSTSNAAGVARCVAAGDTCTPFDADEGQCSGSAISLCVGGVKQTFDCASQGMQCVPGPPGHCG